MKQTEDGTQLLDFGIDAPGSLTAGLALAEVCMSGLGQLAIVPCAGELWQGPAVQVATDHPVAACMASQYAGWKIAQDEYFAMGSGPMRAAAAREELFEKIGHFETSDVAVGVLETRELPPAEVCRTVADACGVKPENLTLLVAPTASQAGTVQIVARSVETALHKLFELNFDLDRIESGFGTAPLPPVAADDVAAIGRTNDAILYGAQIVLWVRGDDESLEAIGPKVPSNASKDHGRPFAEIFESYDRDFYKIDPQLFSPAEVVLSNKDTGSSFRFGLTMPEVIRHSFNETSH